MQMLFSCFLSLLDVDFTLLGILYAAALQVILGGVGIIAYDL